MTEQIFRNSLKENFYLDSETIINLRQKQLDNIKQIDYPKIGKIKLGKIYLENLNVKYNSEKTVKILPRNINNLVDDENNIIIIKDGNIIYNNLDEEYTGVEIISYFDALQFKNENALQIFNNNFIKENNNKLMAINSAYQNSAILINIPKNKIVKSTLKLHIIGENSDLVHHTYIISGQNSEFSIVEKLDNLKRIDVNYVSEVVIEENAKLNYIGIDRLSEKTNAFIERDCLVKDNGSVIYALGQLNDGFTVSNNIINLAGKNAHCESRNILFTDMDNIHAVTVRVNHLAPYTVGTIINHGIVKDKGYLHVDGIGKINQGMNQSNSQQHTNIINLSNSAKVYANPYLLIDEYDVLAGHGATIGKVDDEQLYYLMSRGLSKNEAEKLIILGFLYPLIELIDSESIKNSFIQTIESKLSI